jgi:Ner family transcriptional regulator
MNTSRSTKKRLKGDWHKEDIKAALAKLGWSLSGLSKHHGYCRTALAKALIEPWPYAEHLIAEAIGVKPWVIWPSRYIDQTPNRGREMLGRRKGKDTTPPTADNFKQSFALKDGTLRKEGEARQ